MGQYYERANDGIPGTPLQVTDAVPLAPQGCCSQIDLTMSRTVGGDVCHQVTRHFQLYIGPF